MASPSLHTYDLRMLMLGLVFLHGGGFAAPVHYHLDVDPEFGGDENSTFTGSPPSINPDHPLDNITFVKETLVHVQVTPPETFDLVDFAAIHQSITPIQSFIDSGSYMVDSVMRFFRETVFYGTPDLPHPSTQRSVEV